MMMLKFKGTKAEMKNFFDACPTANPEVKATQPAKDLTDPFVLLNEELPFIFGV